MALGKRKDEQQEMWVATTSLPKSQGHVFYRKLNEVFGIGTPRGLQAAGGFVLFVWFAWIHIHNLLSRYRDSQTSADFDASPCAMAVDLLRFRNIHPFQRAAKCGYPQALFLQRTILIKLSRQSCLILLVITQLVCRQKIVDST